MQPNQKRTIMTTRKIDEVLGDQVLWRALPKVLEWAATNGWSSATVSDTPNPYYGATIDGLVLIGSYGFLTRIGTPLGEFELRGRHYQHNWLLRAEDALGLVMLQEQVTISEGQFGPVWGITRTPDGTALPLPVWRVKEFNNQLPTHPMYSVGIINPEQISAEVLKERLTALGFDKATQTFWDNASPEAVYSDMVYHYNLHLWEQIKHGIF